MAGQGLQNIPLRIPEKWDAAWYSRHIREVLALADTRNAIEGSGIVITGQPGEAATISTSEDLQNLLLQAYVVASPSGFLNFERVLAGEPGVIDIADGGANANITVSIEDHGINLGKLIELSNAGILGNPVDAVGEIQNINPEQALAVLHYTGSGIEFDLIDHTYVSDFDEAAQDAVGAILTDTASIDLVYNDGSNTISANIIDEYVQDLMATTLVDSTSIDFSYSDVGNTITAATINANPTGLIGMTAVNGTAATPLRSDGRHAIDPAIAPEWTANHGWADNAEIQLGTGNDLRVYHDGTDSFIRNDTGSLRFLYGSNIAARILSTGELLVRRATSSHVTFALQVGDGNSDLRGLFTSNNVYSIAVANGASGGKYYMGASASASPDLLFSNNLGTERLRLTDNGRLYGTALHNNAGAVTGATNQYIASGTYTPTLTGVANITTGSSAVCQWMRVGNVVTVSGFIAITSNAAGGTFSSIGVSLPIASSFTNIHDCAGAGSTAEGNSIGAYADAANDRAEFSWAPTTAGISISQSFTFTYLVL